MTTFKKGKMTTFKSYIVFLAAVLLVALVVPGRAMAADPIKLTYASPMGPNNTLSMVDKMWIDKIQKETNGRVQITPYWGGALMTGADAIDEMVAGTADIGLIASSAAKTGYEITKASLFFFHGANQTIGARVFKEWRAKFPELEREFKGLKVLAFAGGPDFQLVSRVPVRKVEDLKGMRILGRADTATMYRALGADAQLGSQAEVYMQMQKKMLDGTSTMMMAFQDLKLAEVAKYCTMVNIYGVPTGMRVMNLGSYNRLPADIRKIIDDSVDWWGTTIALEMIKADKAGHELAMKSGVEFINFSKADLDKFYAPWKARALKEAEALDAKGLPGTKMLQEAERLIQVYSK